MSVIYLITNNINGKQYVGKTIHTIEERWKGHCQNTKSNKLMLLHRAIVKYGKENFTIEAIYETDDNDFLNTAEIYCIKKFNTKTPNGYNIASGGEGNPGNKSRLGIPHKKESIDKMIIIANTPEGKLARSNGGKLSGHNKGGHLSNITKIKISISAKGNKRALGYKHTEETKKHLSEMLIGKSKPESFGEKISIALKNKPKSEQHKLAIKEAQSRPDVKKKQSEVKIGNQNAKGSYDKIKSLIMEMRLLGASYEELEKISGLTHRTVMRYCKDIKI